MPETPSALPLPSTQDPIPNTNWRGNGVVGGWDLIKNGDCSFLSGGEERNWWFSGEESWDFPTTTTEHGSNTRTTSEGTVTAATGGEKSNI